METRFLIVEENESISGTFLEKYYANFYSNFYSNMTLCTIFTDSYTA